MRFLCSLPAALTAAGIVLLSLAARPAAAQQKTYVMKISTPTAIALMPRLSESAANTMQFVRASNTSANRLARDLRHCCFEQEVTSGGAEGAQPTPPIPYKIPMRRSEHMAPGKFSLSAMQRSSTLPSWGAWLRFIDAAI